MGSGVQSFAVGNGGQNVYWLNTGGTLNESINGGPGYYGARPVPGLTVTCSRSPWPITRLGSLI